MLKPLATSAEQFDAVVERFVRRFVRVNAQNIDAFADAFASYIQFTECPRDIREVVEHLGVLVEPTLIERAGTARWDRVNGRYAICYSQYASSQVAAFSIAHELFEMLASNSKFPTKLNKETLEFLANRFAAQFLMPAEEIRVAAKPLNTPAMRRYLIVKLADRFGVSVAAMRIRVYDLGIVKSPAEVNRFYRQQETAHGAA